MRLTQLLPTMLLAAVVSVATSANPVSSIHDDPPVQMEVSPARSAP